MIIPNNIPTDFCMDGKVFASAGKTINLRILG